MKFNAKISPKLYKYSVNIFGNSTLKKKIPLIFMDKA